MKRTLVAALAAAALAACGGMDLVAVKAVETFTTLTVEAPLADQGTAWVQTGPGGETFAITKDFSGPGDYILAVDAGPFIAAGLDPSRLPAGYAVDPADGRLVLSFDAGAAPIGDGKTPADVLRGILAAYRPTVGYHEELDHYGILIGPGVMVEWARDLAANDKDLVYVLNPEPLVAAGVDPARISGWVFGQVTVKEPDGTRVKKDKFLRPYNLR